MAIVIEMEMETKSRSLKAGVAMNTSLEEEIKPGCWRRFWTKKKWVKIVGWFHTVAGAICVLILLTDVFYINTYSAAVSRMSSNATETPPTHNVQEAEAYHNIVASLARRLAYLLTYSLRSMMGFYLVRAVWEENPKNMKSWMLVTLLCIPFELSFVFAIALITKQLDWLSLAWEVIVIIVTAGSICLVYLYIRDLQNYNVSSIFQKQQEKHKQKRKQVQMKKVNDKIQREDKDRDLNLAPKLMLTK